MRCSAFRKISTRPCSPFRVSSGWCAHRIEELTTGGRIIRPAYRALPTGQTYIPLKDRHYDAKSVL